MTKASFFWSAEDSIDYFQNSYHLFAKSDYSSPDMESSDTGDIGIPWEELPYLDGLKLTVQSWDDNYNDIEVDVTVPSGASGVYPGL